MMSLDRVRVELEKMDDALYVKTEYNGELSNEYARQEGMDVAAAGAYGKSEAYREAEKMVKRLLRIMEN